MPSKKQNAKLPTNLNIQAKSPREALELVMQDQIEDVEKKEENRQCEKCQTKKRHRGYSAKMILSSQGDLKLFRVLANYLEYHKGRMNYRERLLEGRSIGGVQESYRGESEANGSVMGHEASEPHGRALRGPLRRTVEWLLENRCLICPQNFTAPFSLFIATRYCFPCYILQYWMRWFLGAVKAPALLEYEGGRSPNLKIDLENSPTVWFCEAGYWASLEILSEK